MSFDDCGALCSVVFYFLWFVKKTAAVHAARQRLFCGHNYIETLAPGRGESSSGTSRTSRGPVIWLTFCRRDRKDACLDRGCSTKCSVPVVWNTLMLEMWQSIAEPKQIWTIIGAFSHAKLRLNALEVSRSKSILSSTVQTQLYFRIFMLGLSLLVRWVCTTELTHQSQREILMGFCCFRRKLTENHFKYPPTSFRYISEKTLKILENVKQFIF